MEEVLNKVLKKIKPTPAETKKFKSLTVQILKKINTQLKKEAKAILGGSGEKDTWLSGSHDIDIFVLFDYQKYKDQSDEISNILEEKLKKVFPELDRLHGSRDYFQFTYQNYLFEIVPILKLSQSRQAINITDISPLHAQWVKKQGVKITDDIRLAKKFAKAVNCYGAESYISGFSGYVLEILISFYGSFENFIKNAASWEYRDIIDIENYYKTKLDLLKEVNSSKLISPIIVLDPVDKTRNASAALNMEKFLHFKQKAQEFFSSPSLDFFERQTISFKELEKNTTSNLIYLEVDTLVGKEDVVGCKLLKVFRYLEEELKKFDIREAKWVWNKGKSAVFYFILEKLQIEPFIIRQGPPLKMEEQAKKFKKKNKEAFEKNNRLFVKIPFKNNKLEDYLKGLLKENYVKDRIKKVKSVKFA